MAEGYGACLINKPQVVKDMVRHVRNQVDNPHYAVSIKIRYTCLSHYLFHAIMLLDNPFIFLLRFSV